MSKQCIFIALSNQKGGVGKSTMTVLLASYFHYVRGKTVAVMDCDYPQFSIQTLRDRDVSNVEKSEQLQRKLCEQYERVGKKAILLLLLEQTRFWKRQAVCRKLVTLFSLIYPER